MKRMNVLGITGAFVALIGAGAGLHPAPAAAKESTPVARASSGGQIDLSFNRDALAALGLRVEGERRGSVLLALQAGASPLAVKLGDGAPTAFGAGSLELPGLRFRRADGARTPILRVVASTGLDLSLQDSRGVEWLRIAYAMRSPNVAQDGLRFYTADLRVGSGLAQFARAASHGEAIANASLKVPLTFLAGSAPVEAKTCASPVWPGTVGSVTDVVLTDIDTVGVQRCRQVVGGGACDGPGGTEGEVVITPSATLRNSVDANAADVPWYTKFSGIFAPYNNDQHPFLIWNLYRFDADGRIEQIARSGLKHAFATANTACIDTTCNFNGHILGRGCSDLYNEQSNECATFLGPRTDLIPAEGRWGRCGSIHDPDCDGTQSPPTGGGFCAPPNTSPAGDGYSFRLRALESAIDPAANPGSRWLIDAWYVVRDDQDIFNTMGSREVFPTPVATALRWNMGTPGAFVAGAVIDRWREGAAPGDESRRSDVAGAEGRLGVAARAHRLLDGRWQYDYAIMNFDYARVQTDGTTAEPNLRILSHVGIDAISLDLANGATVDSAEFRDGDASGANDWVAANAPGSHAWTAPGSNLLGWGQLMFVRVVSTAAPGEGELRLRAGAAGTPSDYALDTLVPDGGNLFRDGFE
jgi:hypothetical protein